MAAAPTHECLFGSLYAPRCNKTSMLGSFGIQKLVSCEPSIAELAELTTKLSLSLAQLSPSLFITFSAFYYYLHLLISYVYFAFAFASII